jgi:catechol 2,3-dioxygenase-like lactoylglutathione lyase family enzyme
MNKRYLTLIGLVASFAIGFYINSVAGKTSPNEKTVIIYKEKQNHVKLGAFSISLSVKDFNISKEFYEKLGFTVLGGSPEKKYLIMKNDNALIGLFQGMFQGNILTFNPGWDETANNLKNFEDIREIQNQLKLSGLALITEADEKTKGPASIMLKDPDGNMILVDQHR